MDSFEFLFDLSLLSLSLFATAVMAISGALQAARYGFDPFGATVLAAVTALGGGTLRDVLLGAEPVFWLKDHVYLSIAVPVALATFMLARRVQIRTGRRLRLLLYFDAAGLALFSLVGLEIARVHGVSDMMAVVLGCITGTTGGVLRDMLCGITPLVLKEDLYATLSIAGGFFYIFLLHFLPTKESLVLAFFFILVSRIIVLLRQFSKKPEKQL